MSEKTKEDHQGPASINHWDGGIGQLGMGWRKTRYEQWMVDAMARGLNPEQRREEADRLFDDHYFLREGQSLPKVNPSTEN